MRPIDADVLENMGYELHRTYQQDANTMVYEVKKISDLPTIEVEPNSCKYWDSESHFCALRRPQAEPVRRGRWKYAGVNTYDGVTVYEPTYRCSVCGRIFESYVRLDMPVMPKDASFPRYCPNCGARMEEQE